MLDGNPVFFRIAAHFRAAVRRYKQGRDRLAVKCPDEADGADAVAIVQMIIGDDDVGRCGQGKEGFLQRRHGTCGQHLAAPSRQQ
ncbi:hypothetical protein D9M72_626830 [compost metagenome]